MTHLSPARAIATLNTHGYHAFEYQKLVGIGVAQRCRVVLLTLAAHRLETNESDSVPALPLSFPRRLSPVQSVQSFAIVSFHKPPLRSLGPLRSFHPHSTHYVDTITITLIITPSWLA
jgi:hypothetical protein